MSATYNSYTIQIQCVILQFQKGTVLKIIRWKKEVIGKNKGELVNSGVGDLEKKTKQTEIAVLGKIQDTLTVLQKDKDEDKGKSNVKLENEDKKLINNILKNIFIKRSDLEVKRLVTSLIKEKDTPKGKLTKSNRKTS